MEAEDFLKWWGYRHINGEYQVKRYFSELDIAEAEESPFVSRVFYPFEASGRDDALEKVKKLDFNLKG